VKLVLSSDENTGLLLVTTEPDNLIMSWNVLDATYGIVTLESILNQN
jgi:hypothetical protein